MYIVTGGAGLIGSACVWALNQRGIEDIIIVDNLGTSEKWKNLRGLRYAEYYQRESFLKLLYENCIPNVKAVIHMGACSATTETDAVYLLKNNIEYTQHLALWSIENNVRFIYASSAATYGDGSNGFDDSEEILNSLRPLNMYGYSKQYFDQWAKRRGLFKNICGLKFSNVFGPNENHKGNMRSVVKRAFEQIVEDGTVKLFKSYKEQYADGEQMRDFVYVKDAAKMIMYLIDNPNVNGLYNIGSGVTSTWNQLVSCVFKALNLKPKIQYIDMPETLREKYQYFTESKISKLQATGYLEPPTKLEDAVKDYVVNYLLNDDYLGDE
ncbi:MAG: ADP-glyceromanno-heptose 6-epimerase [Lentisphaeria bacterium]